MMGNEIVATLNNNYWALCFILVAIVAFGITITSLLLGIQGRLENIYRDARNN